MNSFCLHHLIICKKISLILNQSFKDAESWMALLDHSSLHHKALQISITPSHLRCETALLCHDINRAEEDIVHVTHLPQ